MRVKTRSKTVEIMYEFSIRVGERIGFTLCGRFLTCSSLPYASVFFTSTSIFIIKPSLNYFDKNSIIYESRFTYVSFLSVYLMMLFQLHDSNNNKWEENYDQSAGREHGPFKYQLCINLMG